MTSVKPNNGPTVGGTPVTITGTNFSSGAGVTFGAMAATNVVVVNSTTITATTPAQAAGAVTVTDDGGRAERLSDQRVHLRRSNRVCAGRGGDAANIDGAGAGDLSKSTADGRLERGGDRVA